MELPPGVFEEGGNLYREREVKAEDGEVRMQRRRVSLDAEEARINRMDYFHHQLGWVLEGYKLEKNRTPEDIMADGSTATPLPVEEQEKRRQKIAARTGESSE